MKDNKELVILAGKGGSGGGGSGTDSNAVHYTADAGKSDSEKAQARSNINAASADVAPAPSAEYEGYYLVASEDGTASWEPLRHEHVITQTSITLTPFGGDYFKCGELSSLTIASPPATGEYTIVFTSGSTATVTTIPATILGLESFAAEANTLYEINVLDNRAVVGSWVVSA